MFLLLREEAYRDAPLWRARLTVQPAIDLGQYQVLRWDGVARAAITWAFLSDEAERTLLDGDRLEPALWCSGPNLWVQDIFAPYGQGTGAAAMNWPAPCRTRSIQFAGCAGLRARALRAWSRLGAFRTHAGARAPDQPASSQSRERQPPTNSTPRRVDRPSRPAVPAMVP